VLRDESQKSGVYSGEVRLGHVFMLSTFNSQHLHPSASGHGWNEDHAVPGGEGRVQVGVAFVDGDAEQVHREGQAGELALEFGIEGVGVGCGALDRLGAAASLLAEDGEEADVELAGGQRHFEPLINANSR
jgi:hypothetical protein